MTPHEAQQALLEAGFFSQWEGRHLKGFGYGHKRPDPWDWGFEFKVSLVGEPTNYHVLTTITSPKASLDDVLAAFGEVLPKETPLRDSFPSGKADLEGLFEVSPDEGLYTGTLTLKRDDLQSTLQVLIPTLRKLQGQTDTPLSSDAAFLLGQVAPTAKNQVEALSEVLISGMSLPLSKEQVAQLKLPGYPWEPRPMSVAERLARFPAEEFDGREALKAECLAQALKADSFKTLQEIKGNRSTNQVSVGGEPKNYVWYPLERLENFEVRLRTVDGKSSFKHEPLTMTPETFVSWINQTRRAVPDMFIDVLAFSTREIKDGLVQGIVLITKADPPKSEEPPEWIAKVGANRGSQGGVRWSARREGDLVEQSLEQLVKDQLESKTE